MKKKLVILTGGAGFIGSCFLWKLNQQGIGDIIVVDNLSDSGKWKNLLGKRFHDYIEKEHFLDILESGKLKSVSSIVHMGACTSTILSDAGYFLKNNYEYSKRLALWAFKNDTQFIYASSAATYGAGENGYDDRPEILERLRPLNIYGYSKHLFDLWLLRNGFLPRVTGFKFFNVFGPNEYHKGEMMSVICKRFNDLRDERAMRLFKSYRDEYKDGEQKRDFIYVKDAVEVMWYFFIHPGKRGIFNLGTGEPCSWNELAKAMFTAMGRQPKIEYIDMPAEIRDKYQYFTKAEIGKLRLAGCQHNFMSIEDAIKDYFIYLNSGAYL